VRGIFGLVSILMVVLILGIVAALSLGSNGATPTNPTGTTTTTSGSHASGTTTTGPSVASEAAVVACESNAETLETAVGTYDSANLTPIATEVVGTGPGNLELGNPTSYGNATQAQLLIRGDFLSSWPLATSGYALSLSSTVAGAIEVYVPAVSRHGTQFESETSTSGCNKL
jgi:hypothetical protein